MPLPDDISTLMIEGDVLSSEEFLRRWKEMPGIRRAELIDGIVCLPAPVSIDHSKCESFMNGWLTVYAIATPGCLPSIEATWLMGNGQNPQPDVVLQISPENGGQAGRKGNHFSGAPELIVEVALTSYSRDFGTKKRLYERMGVREYVIVVPLEEKIESFTLTADGFQPVGIDSEGVLQSICFPGLWLDTKALWDLDFQRMETVLKQGMSTQAHADFAARLAASKR